MARTRSSSLERRAPILQSAARLFAEHGYVTASLRQIAEEANCSSPLLAHHFGDKARVLEAVVGEQSTRCQERLVELKPILARNSSLVLDNFMAAWAQYEFDQYDTPDGRWRVTLMLRLQAGREVSDEVRKALRRSAHSGRRWPGGARSRSLWMASRTIAPARQSSRRVFHHWNGQSPAALAEESLNLSRHMASSYSGNQHETARP